MANRIKGITVEINGDTTGLGKALKKVQTTIHSTQASLRDVNRLLKLDPKNTELLAQKQKMLKDAIAATKEKLDTLKTAQAQAKEQLESGTLGQEKYDALQREIIETEQDLKKLQEASLNTNAKLERIDVVGQKMETAGNAIAGVGSKMMPATLAIAGVGTAAVKTAADFDTQMSKVSAISGATGEDFQKLRDKAQEMGEKTKLSASEAGSAFEYMAMAGWKTEDMLDGIVGVLKAAFDMIVGVTNTVLGWFGTNWKEVWTGIKTFFTNIWNGIVNFFTSIWNRIKSIVTGAVNAVRTTVTSVFTAVSSTVKSIWNGIKTAISGVVNGIKSTVTSVFNSVKSTVSSIFNSIKSTATSVWNGIKNAIVRPIEAAKNTVRNIVNQIKGFFSNMRISLPHIKLPHFSISGKFSLAPPRVPHFSVSWYKEGGIMTKPTVFGMNGSALMAGGEVGQEAILPLKGFYDKLEGMLNQRDTSLMEQYLSVIAGNSEKVIVLDSGELVGALTSKMDSALGRRARLRKGG